MAHARLWLRSQGRNAQVGGSALPCRAQAAPGCCGEWVQCGRPGWGDGEASSWWGRRCHQSRKQRAGTWRTSEKGPGHAIWDQHGCDRELGREMVSEELGWQAGRWQGELFQGSPSRKWALEPSPVGGL